MYPLAVATRVFFATFGVIPGSAWNISAAMPLTTAVACEVPVPLMQQSPTRASGWS
jgi:hypothetical protein